MAIYYIGIVFGIIALIASSILCGQVLDDNDRFSEGLFTFLIFIATSVILVIVFNLPYKAMENIEVSPQNLPQIDTVITTTNGKADTLYIYHFND